MKREGSVAEPDQISISHNTYAMVKDQIACDQKGETRMKGIVNPIQTYQVDDVHTNLPQNEWKVEESGSGFSLVVDFAQLQSVAVPHLLGVLETTVNRLTKNSIDHSQDETNPAVER